MGWYRWLPPLVVAAGLVPVTTLTHAATPAQGDELHGRAIYEARCAACHSLDRSRIGPAHRGVFGRHAGEVAGYEYSAALKRSKIVWNARTLDRWLKDPEQLVPGQKMGFMVPDSQDRSDVIAYLASPAAK